ncbi:MAG: hypothetical protein U1E76_21810 [Planctomycetota bacterium]
MRSSRLSWLCHALSLSIGIGAALHEPARASEFAFHALGTETRVNQDTGYAHDHGWVAMDDQGRSVVVWTSLGDVFARLYASDGQPRTDEIRVNQATAGNQNAAKVACRPDGTGFVVVWNDWYGADGNLMGCFGRVFDGDGEPVTPELPINALTDGSQFDPAVAIHPDGEFVVAWVDAGSHGASRARVVLRRFGADGTAMSDEIAVSESQHLQLEPTVAVDRSGRIVVAYTDAGATQDGERDVMMRAFGRDGEPITAQMRVNDDAAGVQHLPRIAAAGNGRFMVVWQDDSGRDGHGCGVLARVFERSGAPLTSDLVIAANVYGDQQRPAVACDFIGNFSVAWEDRSPGDTDVLLRRFDNAGYPLMQPVRISMVSGGNQVAASIAVDASGEIVATSFTHQNEIWARWFASPAIEQLGPALLGGQVALAVWMPSCEKLTYQMLASFGTRPGLSMPQDRRLLLNPDALFHYAMAFPDGREFQRFRRELNEDGQGYVTIDIPADPSMRGTSLYFAAAAVDLNQGVATAFKAFTRPFELHIP